MRGRSFYRNIISRINSILFRSTFSNKITDYSNGFRIYTRKVAEYTIKENIRYTTPIYLGEVLIYWMNNNFKIIEIAGTYINRNAGQSQVVFSDVLSGLRGYFYLKSIEKHNENY